MAHDINTSANELNNDLKKLSNWAFQWKTSFNPDPCKQAQEVIFSRKLKKVTHPPLVFNNANVSQCKSQKHLGIILDPKLTFDDHYKAVLSKTNRTTGLLRKLQNLLPKEALITIYKAFFRPHLDYGDVLFDQAFNASFHGKLESKQYNACLALTRAIRGTSTEKLYQELSLESLQLRRWYKKLYLFYKIFKNKSPAYLFNLIPERNTHYSLRTSDNILCFNTQHSFLKNSFFPSTIIRWNKLDLTLRKCDSFNVFKKEILKFIRPSNSFYNCHNPIGIKYITTIRLGLSHLREHKLKHSFQDPINPILTAAMMLNLQFIFFSTVPYIVMNAANS